MTPLPQLAHYRHSIVVRRRSQSRDVARGERECRRLITHLYSKLRDGAIEHEAALLCLALSRCTRNKIVERILLGNSMEMLFLQPQIAPLCHNGTHIRRVERLVEERNVWETLECSPFVTNSNDIRS